MTLHPNASFRIYDPPLSHVKPCSKLLRWVGGRAAHSHACTAAILHAGCTHVPPFFAIPFRWWRSSLHHLPLLGKAECLFPSLHGDKHLRSAGSQAPGYTLHMEKGLQPRGPGVPGPSLLFVPDSGILTPQLPDAGRPQAFV